MVFNLKNLSTVKKYLLPFVVILFPALVSAQVSLPAPDSSWMKAFLFDQFVDGTVKLKSGAQQQATLNYHTDNQHMYFKQDNQLMELTNADDIDTIILDDHQFVAIDGRFYEVTEARGAIQLLVSYSSRKRPITATADHNGISRRDNSSVSNTVSNVYTLRPFRGDYSIEILKHYWLKRGKSLNKVNNENQLVKVFPLKHQEMIKSYMAANHVSFNDPTSVAGLINYGNGLK